MPHPALPLTGTCRCGQVRLTVTAAPLLTSICHCTGCQRMTGSAFSTTVTVPTDGLDVEGETVIGGLHGPQARHHHCDRCKGWVFTRVAPDMGFVNVRATMLDGAADWFKPFLELYTSEGLPWALAGARHAFETFPAMEAYADLVAEYQAGATAPA